MALFFVAVLRRRRIVDLRSVSMQTTDCLHAKKFSADQIQKGNLHLTMLSEFSIGMTTLFVLDKMIF